MTRPVTLSTGQWADVPLETLAEKAPGDGFLPKDMPAGLLAEPTIPSGHPEGFHDAFARLHRCFEADVRKWKAGENFSRDGSEYANVEDGRTGIAFLDACVRRNCNNGIWTTLT